MSLNTIDFSKRNIADLYTNTLVEFNEKRSTEPETGEIATPKYLGENRKKVLIVVNYPEAVHIPDKQLSFLTNLLSACKLNLGDIALLNFHLHTNHDFESIISYFKPTTVFLFGVAPDDFGMPLLFPHYQQQSYKEATYLLFLPCRKLSQIKF